MAVHVQALRCLVIVCSVSVARMFPEDMYRAQYRWIEEGDVSIGAILSIHSHKNLFKCTDYIQDARKVQNVEALNFAVQEINNRTDLLPNIKLGFDILDDCQSPSLAIARAMQFIPRDMRLKYDDTKEAINGSDFDHDTSFYDVVGVIGAYTSTLSIEISKLLNLFKLPQISHTATSDVLSDRNRFPYFFRMVPPDKFQASAITSLLHWFDWNHMAVVYSEGNYGHDGVKELRNTFQTIKGGICIEEAIEINYGSTETDFIKLLQKLNAHTSTKVVVAFLEIEDAFSLVNAVIRTNLVGRFVWVGSDSFNMLMMEERTNCNAFPGSLFVHPYAETSETFRDHLAALNSYGLTKSKNPWIHELIRNDQITNSTTHNSSDWLLVSDRDKLTPGFLDSFLIDSVYAFAYALQNVIDNNCSSIQNTPDIFACVSQVGLYQELKQLRFNGSIGEIGFNKFGYVKSKYAIQQCANKTDWKAAHLVSVGFWDMTDSELLLFPEKMVWTRNESPFSSCPRPCTEEIGTIYYFAKQTCCHECIPCKQNEIAVANATRCELCPELHWPDNARRSCLPIFPVFYGLENTLSIALCVCAIAGVVVCMCVTATLVRYHEEHVIKCFSVELSGIILLGTLFTFGIAGSFLTHPNTVKCYINHVGFSLTFTIIYAPLLVKTNRIYRIFKAGRRTTRKPCLISTSSQVVIAISLIIGQVRKQTSGHSHFSHHWPGTEANTLS